MDTKMTIREAYNSENFIRDNLHPVDIRIVDIQGTFICNLDEFVKKYEDYLDEEAISFNYDNDTCNSGVLRVNLLWIPDEDIAKWVEEMNQNEEAEEKNS